MSGFSSEKALFLKEEEKASVVLNKLFFLRKAANPRYSLTVLCRKTGAASKGKISEFLRGQRRLKAETLSALAQEFGFSQAETQYLLWLMEKEFSKNWTDRDERELSQRRKLMTLQTVTASEARAIRLFWLDVFASFGLVEQPVSECALAQLFPGAAAEEIAVALRELTRLGLLRLHESEPPRWSVTGEHIQLTGPGTGGNLAIELLRQSLHDADEKVAEHFHESDLASFSTDVFTVNREDFVKTLADLKKDIFVRLLDLDREKGDLVIRASFQIYPVAAKRGNGSKAADQPVQSSR